MGKITATRSHANRLTFERAGKVPVEEVFAVVATGVRSAEFCGHLVRIQGPKFDLFGAQKGCLICGLQATHWAVERQLNGPEDRSWMLHLYTIRESPNGRLQEILMTRDHIIPLRDGGPNTFANSQVLCQRCNGRKDAMKKGARI